MVVVDDENGRVCVVYYRFQNRRRRRRRRWRNSFYARTRVAGVGWCSRWHVVRSISLLRLQNCFGRDKVFLRVARKRLEPREAVGPDRRPKIRRTRHIAPRTIYILAGSKLRIPDSLTAGTRERAAED